MKKIITISKVDILSSGKNKFGKDWTLYAVYDENGDKYTTFSGYFQNKVGQQVDIEYVEVQREYNGKTYTDRRVIDRSPAERRHEELKVLLWEINEKVDYIVNVFDKKINEKQF